MRQAKPISLLAALLLSGCVLSFASASAAQAREQAASAAQIRPKVIAALGGERRLEMLRSLRATGEMVGVSGFPGTFELLAAAPASRLVTWDIKYLKETIAADSGQGWRRSAAVRQLAGDELEREQRNARFNPLYALLRSGAPFAVTAGECGSNRPVHLLAFGGPGTTQEVFGIDRTTFLPVCSRWREPYEEGLVEVSNSYGDYRSVDGLKLPFEIKESRPDNTLNLKVRHYELNPEIAPQIFANPETPNFGRPVRMELATLPGRIFKEADGHYTSGHQRYWGMYFYPSESWSLDLVVKEAHGRFLEPKRAQADLYAGHENVASQEWEPAALRRLRRHPVTRFTPLGEIYGFRHNFSVPATMGVDRLVYTFTATGPGGQEHQQSLEIPVTTYTPKARLIFPLKGKFLVTSGHEYFELEHKYERSQQFSIDVVALGDNFEFASNDGASAEDYVGYGRREIIAPADGRVVFARNDIPDGAVKSEFLRMENAITAPAGNVVIIDHGSNEFSIFCHLRFGSVAVKTGDVVKQGQRIGLMGAAGSPGLPHLHYQLQNGPNIFGNDGLPLVFSNIERVGWLGRRASDDEPGAAAVDQPRAGVFMQAH